MKNYNVSDEPVTEVAVDINDIKDTCNENGRNEECVFLVAGRMIYRKGLDFLFDALMRIPQETRYQVRHECYYYGTSGKYIVIISGCCSGFCHWFDNCEFSKENQI